MNKEITRSCVKILVLMVAVIMPLFFASYASQQILTDQEKSGLIGNYRSYAVTGYLMSDPLVLVSDIKQVNPEMLKLVPESLTITSNGMSFNNDEVTCDNTAKLIYTYEPNMMSEAKLKGLIEHLGITVSKIQSIELTCDKSPMLRIYTINDKDVVVWMAHMLAIYYKKD